MNQPFAPAPAIRLAALDIGSLTVRLGLAESRSVYCAPRLLWCQEAVTCLGAEMAATGRIGCQAQADTIRVLEKFVALCRIWQVERVSAVATQAVRQAENQEDFLRQVFLATGLELEVLSPETEAALCLRGVLSGLAPGTASHRPLVIFDLGGGSLELVILPEESPPKFLSLPFGALTLARSWQRSDPPRPEELISLEKQIRENLRAFKNQAARQPASFLVGTGGAITTLAVLQLRLNPDRPEAVNNLTLSREAIVRLWQWLYSLPRAARSRLPGLSPAKAEVILPGTAIILAILEIFSANAVMVMDAGLLEGVLGRLSDQLWEADIEIRPPTPARLEDLAPH